VLAAVPTVEVAIVGIVVAVGVDEDGIDRDPAAIGEHPRCLSLKRARRKQLELLHKLNQVRVMPFAQPEGHIWRDKRVPVPDKALSVIADPMLAQSAVDRMKSAAWEQFRAPPETSEEPNLSTVPTRAPAGRRLFKSETCAL